MVIVFTHLDVQLEIDKDQSLPAETLHVNKLKDLIRKETKNKVLTVDRVAEISDLFNG
jgi:hypothetical protein